MPATVEAAPYVRKAKELLLACDRPGQPLGQAIIGRLKIPLPEAEAVVVLHPANYTFEDGIALVGYGVERVSEGELRLTLCWRAEDHPTRDYNVVLQLVDEEGSIVAQGDGPSLNGD